MKRKRESEGKKAREREREGERERERERGGERETYITISIMLKEGGVTVLEWLVRVFDICFMLSIVL